MAARYLVTGGTGNWNSTTNWSATSGGASGASAPTTGDDVIFDTNSANAPISLGASVTILTINASNYTGTLGLATFNLSVAGNIVLSSGQTITTTTGKLIQTVTASINTNGVAIPNFRFGGTATSTHTLLSDINITELLDRTTSNVNVNITGAFNIYTKSLTNQGSSSANNFSFAGGATLTFDKADGVWAGGSRLLMGGASLTFNLTGDFTFSSVSALQFANGTLIYLSGNIITTGSTIFQAVNLGAITYQCSGIQFNNISHQAGGGFVLTEDLYINGTLFTQYSAGSIAMTAASTKNVYLSNWNANSGVGAGSSLTTINIVFHFVGTSPSTFTLNTVSSTTDTLGNATIVINTSSTLDITGTLKFSNLTWTYTAGIVDASASNIVVSSGSNIDSAGMNFGTITFNTAAATHTLNSLLTASTLTVDINTVFTGVGGWECDIFNLGTTANLGRTITLEYGNTYRVNTDFNSIRSTNSLRAVLQSSDAVNMAYFTCGAGCVMNVGYTNAIRIDSSLGKQVYSFNGVYTTAINWSNTFPVTVAYAFQN